MFKRIDHVELVTAEPQRAIDFYTEVLGFAVRETLRIERSFLGVPMNLAYLELGGTTIELMSYEGACVDPAPQAEHYGYRMLAIEVESMQEAVEYLQKKGVAITWGPMVRETYARAEIRDPDGNGIELREWK